MRRKSFDILVSAGGLLIAVVLLAAGALAMWGYSYDNSTVYHQLSAQDITFPPKAAFAHAKAGTEITPSMIPSVSRYAGQKLTTGAQAEAYANDFIAVHLSEMPYHGVYALISSAARAAKPGSPEAAKLAALEQTSFQGTSLRSMLLNAYGWWEIGQVALVAGIVAFCLAAITLLLSALGLWHSRRVPAEEEIPKLHPAGVSQPQGMSLSHS
jgi:uncharacterized iron-regulated membrane protein